MQQIKHSLNIWNTISWPDDTLRLPCLRHIITGCVKCIRWRWYQSWIFLHLIFIFIHSFTLCWKSIMMKNWKKEKKIELNLPTIKQFYYGKKNWLKNCWSFEFTICHFDRLESMVGLLCTLIKILIDLVLKYDKDVGYNFIF